MKRKSWKKTCDYNMRGKYGEIDFNKKKIRINPHKGEVVETILHEEAHKENPSLTEKQTEDLAISRMKKMTIKEQISLMKKYEPKTHRLTNQGSRQPAGLTIIKGRQFKVLYKN